MSCNVTLLRTTSKKPCTLDVSFGCKGTSMWISSGCRGKFLCEGHIVTCGFSGLAYSGPRHSCTCAPVHFGGTFLAGTGTPSLSMPDGLIDKGAALHPRLVETRQGQQRFVPGSVNESLTATYAIWNLLDATMHHISPEHNYQTGYVRELQLRRMVNLVRRPHVKTYCEIGFNGGHSAVAMLLANPNLHVHSFDLMGWGYSNETSRLLRTMFGRRLTMHRGDSTITVPAWAEETPHRCDVLFVDGDHSVRGATIDMKNMRQAAAPNAMAVADDINSDPGRALEALAKDGSIDVLESYGPFEAPSPHNPCMRTAKRGPYCTSWGFAVYVYPNITRTERVARAKRLAAKAAGAVDRRDRITPARQKSGASGGGGGGGGGGAGAKAIKVAKATGLLVDGE